MKSSAIQFLPSNHRRAPEMSRNFSLKSRCRNPIRKKVTTIDDDEEVEIFVLNPTLMASLWLKFPYIFRIGDHGIPGPSLLHEEYRGKDIRLEYNTLLVHSTCAIKIILDDQNPLPVCLERGWKEFDGLVENSNPHDFQNSPIGWNLWWSHTNHTTRNLKSFSSWQLTNRTNRNFGFTSKDTCTRYIRRLRNTYGEIYDLCPLSFNVPSEYAKLCIEHTQRKSRAFWNFWDRAHYIGTPLRKPIDIEKQPIWICKPVGRSQGKGIVVFDTVTNLTYNTRSVVQEYITRPHLIGDYKWDLRIYVCIVSTHPLVFYAYREGLVRFATNPFDLKNLNNPFAHLTNSSVNKLSPNYLKNKIGVGRGCKWNLRKLRKYFQDKEIGDWYLWQRICAILILTIIGDASAISNSFHQASKARTFFLMGFDIMVDRDLRPVLVEVNSNPSLSNDCEVDRIVKKPMLHDLFDLLNLPDGRDFESYMESNPEMYKNHPTHPIGSNSQAVTSTTSEESSVYASSDSEHEYDDTLNQVSSRTNNGGSLNPKYTLENNFYSALHKNGPISACKEILELALGDEFHNFSTNTEKVDIELQNSAQRYRAHIDYPVLVSIPLKKPNSLRRQYFSQWKTGLTLKAPNWKAQLPSQVGNWVRIFPFNKGTEKMAATGRSVDVKGAIRQVQESLKLADQLSKSKVSDGDASLDQLLQDKLQLTTRVWHPVNPTNSTKKSNKIPSF